tara:strand:- start:133 stop:333 length:201 start_codon:yes stop_codon:yes gene_type:complete
MLKKIWCCGAEFFKEEQPIAMTKRGREKGLRQIDRRQGLRALCAKIFVRKMAAWVKDGEAACGWFK